MTNSNMLTITWHDTIRPLGIQFRPFVNNVSDTKFHKQCTLLLIYSEVFEASLPSRTLGLVTFVNQFRESPPQKIGFKKKIKV